MPAAAAAARASPGRHSIIVSGTFLYLIALLNLVVLISIIKLFREMRTGRYSDEELEKQLHQQWNAAVL